MKYEAETIKRYYFEPSVFGFRFGFIFMYTEIFGFVPIRCLVHYNRVRSFAVIEVYVRFDAFKKIFFRFETITIQCFTLETTEERLHNRIVVGHPRI